MATYFHIPPEGGWEERSYYVVEVSGGKGNPIFLGILYTGFLSKDGRPQGYLGSFDTQIIKRNFMKNLKLLLLSAMIGLMFTGCQDDARVASQNLSKAADNFEITRRIVFYNGITGEYMLSIEGKCAQEPLDNRLAVTCKTGHKEYKKHFLGLSDNVTYFSEQLEAANVSVYHYRVTFKPQQILPDIDFRGSTDAIKDAIIPDNKD